MQSPKVKLVCILHEIVFCAFSESFISLKDRLSDAQKKIHLLNLNQSDSRRGLSNILQLCFTERSTAITSLYSRKINERHALSNRPYSRYNNSNETSLRAGLKPGIFTPRENHFTCKYFLFAVLFISYFLA